MLAFGENGEFHDGCLHVGEEKFTITTKPPSGDVEELEFLKYLDKTHALVQDSSNKEYRVKTHDIVTRRVAFVDPKEEENQ